MTGAGCPPNPGTPQIIEKMEGNTVHLAHHCADDWGLRGASIARAPSRINWLCCENWLATEHEATSSRSNIASRLT
jgi:hypothetical protein